jgi:hypothetical protein
LLAISNGTTIIPFFFYFFSIAVITFGDILISFAISRKVFL